MNETSLKQFHQHIAAARDEIGKVIIGQQAVIDLALITILTGGHALIEGVPGVAKTLMVRTLASVMSVESNRIQFTPDLMPADITGMNIFNMKTQEFTLVKGPVFTTFLLADEINRAPAKTQSALLQAMQERIVTVCGTTYDLPKPFLVLATQNPIEQEGTYPLPEAQLDLFMFAIRLEYPTLEEEIQVVKNTTDDQEPVLNTLFTAEEILEIQHLIRRTPVPDNVVRYAVELAQKTRPGQKDSPELVNQYLDWGAGPRASQNLVLAAKAHAAVDGRFSPDIADVKAVAPGILRHRILRNYKAEADGVSDEAIIEKLL